MAQKKSKRWSMKDIKKIKSFLDLARAEGNEEYVGIVAAAQFFGITPNAVRIRYGRYLKGQDLTGLKNNTTKVPMHRKKRKYNRSTPIVPQPHKDLKAAVIEGRSMTFKITNVNVDLAAGTITVNY